LKLLITHYSDTWKGLEIGLRADEIDRLVTLLQDIAAQEYDYFTIAATEHDQPFGIENFQIYLDESAEKGNMQILGGALPANGTE